MTKGESPREREVTDVNATPFGTELRRMRRASGLNLVDLAKAASCSLVYVSQIERGEKPPPSRVHIAAMLDRMGCPERLNDMLLLAAKSRRAIEIELKNKSPEETDMLLALARKSEAGEISDDLVKQILGLIGTDKDQK